MTREMLFALVLGYLFGSVPFGLVLTRLTGKGDIRSIGSGNIGATNVLRTGNKLLAALTLILDCLKATAAILLFQPLENTITNFGITICTFCLLAFTRVPAWAIIMIGLLLGVIIA